VPVYILYTAEAPVLYVGYELKTSKKPQEGAVNDGLTLRYRQLIVSFTDLPAKGLQCVTFLVFSPPSA
jgi:hypothetical protein